MKRLSINNSSAAASGSRALAGLVAGLLLLPAQPAAAQPGGKKPTGKIEAAEIEIVKERVNQLPEATRNFQQIRLAPPPKPTRQVAYTFPDFRLPADRLNPSVRVLTIRAEEPAPLTGNFVKAGIGNYGTFYGRAYLHRTRDSEKSYGLDIKHVNSFNGPVDGQNSATSQTSLAATGELYRGTAAFGGALDLGRERYNFYGYDRGAAIPDNGALKQVYNRFGVRAYARNRDPQQQLQYEGGLGFKHWSDSYQASENNFFLHGKAGYALSETSRVTLAAEASFIGDNDTLARKERSRTRTFVQATPAYELTGKRLSLVIGATIGYSSDTINQVRKTSIYPALRAGYTLLPETFTVYGGLGGGIQRVTRYDLSTENYWLNPTLNVADTHRGITYYAGFNAAPLRGLEFNARATYSRDKNLYFYVNNPQNPARFDLVYDSATTGLLNLHGELLYNAGEKIRLGSRADYNKYTVHSLAQPFHRPEFQASVFGTYNVYDKLLLGVEMYFYDASYGIEYQPKTSPADVASPKTYKATDPIYDLNLRADYRITPKLSIFAMGNNLANRQYQRYYRYPVKGINVIGGATYTF